MIRYALNFLWKLHWILFFLHVLTEKKGVLETGSCVVFFSTAQNCIFNVVRESSYLV